MGDLSETRPTHLGPYLEATVGGHQLVVRGKPFLILGGELQNSSFSCTKHMAEIWPRLKAHRVNTVLANVAWESIEPEEGRFNFSTLDENIRGARDHGLHLILLWFGAFKNGKSSYAPQWVKKDATRFPRMLLRQQSGVPVVTEVLSILDPEVVRADSRAFGALLQHIKDFDAEHSTVLMVQVENEVGLLGGSRDVSPISESRFHAPVPNALVIALNSDWDNLHPSLKRNLKIFRQSVKSPTLSSASWPQVFGDNLATDELFMAYHYALYVELVARTGKASYPLPMFTNVWQNYADEDADKSQPVIVGGGGQPGDYPSGGGVINVLDIWQLFAPSLDFIAPDLYLNDYNAVCDKYKHRGQPLFIPEQRRDEYGARRIWSAYGTYAALCTSPFGIDTLDEAKSPWTKHYDLLSQISHHLLAAQTRPGSTFGFFFDGLDEGGSEDELIKRNMGHWNLCIERAFVFGTPGPGFGLIIQLAANRFLLVGEGFQVRFKSLNESSVFSGILSFVEKVWDADTQAFEIGRTFNGDETQSGSCIIMPNTSPDPGVFPISITVPARTRVAECEVYTF